jgi:hypothetical protein
VLHPTDDADVPAGTTHFEWLPYLERVLAPHRDVAVLVHSTWRYTYTDEELRALLGPLGSRLVGSAPRGPRYESIRWWLVANKAFSDYRMLDDDAREFPQPQPAELILCNPVSGVSDAIVLGLLRQWLEAPLAADNNGR